MCVVNQSLVNSLPQALSEYLVDAIRQADHSTVTIGLRRLHRAETEAKKLIHLGVQYQSSVLDGIVG